MTRAREALARTGITVLVAAALVLALANSAYDFRFDRLWPYRGFLAEGLGTTLLGTLLAYVMSLVLGVFVALGRMSRRLWVRHVADLYVEVVRGTPFIVQVSIAWWGFASQIAGIDNRFLVGTASLAVFGASYAGEIIRAGIESVDRGQFEAARSLGLGRYRTLRHVVFPQAFKRMLPPLTGELIALTKESSLLFTIGVFELNAAAKQVGSQTFRMFEALIVAALVYLAINVPLSLGARRLERRLGASARTGVELL